MLRISLKKFSLFSYLLVSSRIRVLAFSTHLFCQWTANCLFAVLFGLAAGCPKEGCPSASLITAFSHPYSNFDTNLQQLYWLIVTYSEYCDIPKFSFSLPTRIRAIPSVGFHLSHYNKYYHFTLLLPPNVIM